VIEEVKSSETTVEIIDFLVEEVFLNVLYIEDFMLFSSFWYYFSPSGTLSNF